MSNLKCAAENCTYNSNGDCYAGGIRIDGKMQLQLVILVAYHLSQNKIINENVLNATNIVSTLNIECKAVKCRFNKSELCDANFVKINAHNESCETFSCN